MVVLLPLPWGSLEFIGVAFLSFSGKRLGLYQYSARLGYRVYCCGCNWPATSMGLALGLYLPLPSCGTPRLIAV
ncbi:hypothetical protein JB92DRAFT_1752174 [Gautieria morchelliformis]|nr:hypothetical protein JB92DRAFT_1752174 [Gautieria morchelliformis]